MEFLKNKMTDAITGSPLVPETRLLNVVSGNTFLLLLQ